jgi:ABC-type dipeptide/oligopeptide/nickel transport system permease subunit
MFERLKRGLGSEPDLTWLESESPQIELPAEPRPEPRRERRFRLEWNAPLLAGGLIVLGLFVVVLFGPMLAPENPYLAGQRSSMMINGEFTTPPFPPMAGLPMGTDQWGRDILSMLLYGTRNTLVACLFIAMSRILMGAALGMLAGWNEGGLLDRLVMSLIEWTTALPALLTGMILILALGIQRGIGIFIIALCFVGWAEIAQYIRSEFMVIRRKPFIEGARVIGLDGMGIAIRHILPNVLPSLIVIAVLEMGAVLMILGELGFIGVFIGGGTWVQVGDTAVANIPDIPEWGAMMAGTRQFARNQTWMVFYPALAFFVAVLGFNLLGEGLRRIVQRRGVSTAFILSKRIVVVIAAITLATAYIVTHVGPAPSYAGLAQRFDAEAALAHVAELTAPALEGRQAGTAGGDAAAAYIAARFADYGLEPISAAQDLRLAMETQVVSPVSPPQLQLLDALGQPLRSLDYPDDLGVDIHGHGGSGEARAPVALITFRQITATGGRSQPGSGQQFRGLDLRGKVALYLADNAPPDFQVEALIRGAVGILLISDDIVPRLQVADPEGDYLVKPWLPVFRIRPAAADEILAADALTVSQLQEGIQDWEGEQAWQMRELTTRVRMALELSPVQTVTSDNVLAVLRGTDAALNKQLIVVSAHYDGVGRLPDGTLLQGANHDAVGVATMLEILRLWKASGFEPRRTMMFAAWTGGEWEHSGAHEYLTAQAQYSVLETVAVVNLDGLGRGGDELWVQGDAQLVDLLLRSAEASGVAARAGDTVRWPYQRAFRAPTATIGWADSQIAVGEDTADLLDAGKLSQAGQAVNLMLITASREYDY